MWSYNSRIWCIDTIFIGWRCDRKCYFNSLWVIPYIYKTKSNGILKRSDEQ